jgi:hypothetical protein
MERYLGIIKIFNIAAAVVIVLGVATLAWLLVDRARGGAERRTVVDTGSIALPAGFTIKEMAATGDFLFLLVTDETGTTLLLRLDPNNPAGTASFVVETARP